MSGDRRENFLRHAILIVDTTKDALNFLIELDLQHNNLTFEQFINKYQHELYHLCYNTRCCQCPPGFNPPRSRRVLYPTQIELLMDKTSKLSCHNANILSDFCCSTAKSGLSVNVLDLTLAKCLLINFCLSVFWYSSLTYPGHTFEDFLNHHKHDLYHLWQYNTSCCQCPVSYAFPCRYPVLNHVQWNTLFNNIGVPCNIHRKRPHSGVTSCLCSMAAPSGIVHTSLDSQFCKTILQYCCLIWETIENLVQIRNHSYGHVTHGEMSDAEYIHSSTEIENGIMAIAFVCKKEIHFKQKIKEAKEICLDNSMWKRYQLQLLDIISKQDELSKSISEIVPALGGKIASRAEQIPIDTVEKIKDYLDDYTRKFKSNVSITIENSIKNSFREQTNKCVQYSDHTRKVIESYRKEGTFVETNAVRHCMQHVSMYNVFIITGCDGSGKSRIGLELLSRFGEADISADLVKLTDLKKVKDALTTNGRFVLLIDDVFQKKTKKEEIDFNALEYLYTCIQENARGKVIMTVNASIRKKIKYFFLSQRFFRHFLEINLDEHKFKMSLTEKETLLSRYCKLNNIKVVNDEELENYKDAIILDKRVTVFISKATFSEIVNAEPFMSFPNACYIFTSNRPCTRLGIWFFKHPTEFVLNEINDIRAKGKQNPKFKMKYVILCFVMLNKKTLTKNCTNSGKWVDIIQKCYPSSSNQLLESEIVRLAADMSGRYLSYNEKLETFTFIHDTVYESVLFSFYEIDPALVISLIDFAYIKDVVRLDGYKRKEIEIVMVIPKLLYTNVIERLISICVNNYKDKLFVFTEQLCDAELMTQNDVDFIDALIENFTAMHSNETISIRYQNKDETVMFYFPASLVLYMSRKQAGYECLATVLKRIETNINKEGNALILTCCKKTLFATFEYLCKNNNDDSKLSGAWNSIKRLCKDCSIGRYIQMYLELGNDTIAYWLLSKQTNIVELIMDTSDLHLSKVVMFLSSIHQIPCSRVRNRETLIRRLMSRATQYNSDVNAAAFSACQRGMIDLLLWIINKFMSSFSSQYNTSLIIKEACRNGMKKIIRVLLQKKLYKHCDLNIIFQTAFHNKWDTVLRWLILDENCFDKKCIMTETIDHCEGSCDCYKDFVHRLLKTLFEERSNKSWAHDSLLIIQWIIENRIHYEKTLAIILREINNYCQPNNTILKLLFKNIRQKTFDINDIMYTSCMKGHLNVVRCLLHKYKNQLFDVDLMLNIASQSDSVELVKIIANERQHSVLECTLLITKAFSSLKTTNDDLITITKYLLDTVPHENLNMTLILENAIRINLLEIVRLLLQKVSHLRFDFGRLLNAMFSLEHVNILDDIVLLILQYVQQSYIDMQRLMFQACENGRSRIVTLLIEHVDHKLFDFVAAANALYVADDYEINEQLLIIILPHVNHSEINMKEVMNKACRYCCEDLIKWLIENVDHKLFDFESAINAFLVLDDHDEYYYEKDERILLLVLPHVNHSGIEMKDVMNKACRSQCKELIKWMVENVEHKCFDFISAINALLVLEDDECYHDNFEEIFLLSLPYANHWEIDMKCLMNKACRYLWLNLVKWLIDNVDSKRFDFISAINVLWVCDDEYNIGRKKMSLIILVLPHVIKWMIENVDNNLFDFVSAVKLVMVLDDDEKYCYNFGLGAKLLLLFLPRINHSEIDMKEIMKKACRCRNEELIKWMVENVDHKLFDFVAAINALLETEDDDVGLYDEEDEDLLLLILPYINHSEIDMKEIMKKACRCRNEELIKWMIENVDHKLFDFVSAIKSILETEDDNVGLHDEEDEDLLLLILPYINHSEIDMKEIMNKACRCKNEDLIKWMIENVDHKLLDFVSAVKLLTVIETDTFWHVKSNTLLRTNLLLHTKLLLLILPHINLSEIDVKEINNETYIYTSMSGEVIEWMIKNVDNNLFDLVSAVKLVMVLDHYNFGLGAKLLLLILPRITHSEIDMKKIIEKACRCRNEELIKWMVENVDHKLLDFVSAINAILETEDDNVGLYDEEDEDLLLLILPYINHSEIDMKEIMNKACRCKNEDLIKWMIENVDHKLLDFVSAVKLLTVIETDTFWHVKSNTLLRTNLLLHTKLLLLILPHINLSEIDVKEINNETYIYTSMSGEVIEWMIKNVDNNLFDLVSAVKLVMVLDHYNFGLGAKLLLLILPRITHSEIDMKKIIEKACRCRNEELIKWMVENVDHKLLDFVSAINAILETEDDNVGLYDEEDEDLLLLILPYINHSEIDMKEIMNSACRYGNNKLIKWMIENVDNKLFNIDSALQIAIRTRNTYREDVVLWILQNVDLKSINIKHVLDATCRMGQLATVRWLLENINHNVFDMKHVMNEVCSHCDVIMVQWIWDNVDHTCFDMKSAMIKACRRNKDLDTIIWLWKNIKHCVFDMCSAMTNACRYNNIEVVKWLWTNLDSALFHIEDALNNACRYSNLDTVKWLLKNVDNIHFNFDKAVIEACKGETDRTETVQALLQGIDRSKLDLQKIFDVACKNQATDIVKWLIDTTEFDLLDTRHLMKLVLDIELRDENTRSKVQEKIEIVSMILDRSNPSEIDMNSVVSNACINGWISIFAKIVTTVDYKHYNISEAINKACKHGQLEIVRWSLDNINSEVIDIATVMNESCGFGWLELVKCMWDKMDHEQFDMETSMNDAFTFGRMDVVEWIFKNVDNKRLDIKNIMIESCKTGCLNIVKILLQNTEQNKFDLTSAIIGACINGKTEIVQWLFAMFGRKYFDLKILSAELKKHSAEAYFKYKDVVIFLLQNFDHSDLDMAVIMSISCKNGWISVVEYILDKFQYNQLGMKNAFKNACLNGETEIVHLLLDNVNHESFDLAKALTIVCQKGWEEILTLLLDKVDHTKLDFQKAMNEACSNDQQHVVELLFQKVDNNSFNIKQTLDIACKCRLNENLVKLILKNSTDSDIDITTVKGLYDNPVVVLE